MHFVSRFLMSFVYKKGSLSLKPAYFKHAARPLQASQHLCLGSVAWRVVIVQERAVTRNARLKCMQSTNILRCVLGITLVTLWYPSAPYSPEPLPKLSPQASSPLRCSLLFTCIAICFSSPCIHTLHNLLRYDELQFI